MSDISNYITAPTHSFAGLSVCTQLNDLAADIAIIGIHFVSPYPQRLATAASQTVLETAPDAVRLQSSIFIDHWDHHDFDFNEILLANRQVRVVDCGDVDKQTNSSLQNSERITAAIRSILSRGAVPITLGTDEGGFIPFVRAYSGYDALCVVHIDAHIDWRNERNGVRDGYSSGMRRASEG
ncbi:Agmatinase (EC [Olavius sp. associated proteobacterium Delta 1]|nr:Agmatinase (EC [Olavius sp. associated proteobacterium Delta 1]